MHRMIKHLQINLRSFPFYFRERNTRNKIIRNRCGRDFLYYALVYYFPNYYGANKITPHNVEEQGLFGISVPATLAWTQLQFVRVVKYLNHKGLKLSINQKLINSFPDFFRATLFSRIGYDDAMLSIIKCVDSNAVAGIDISVGLFGLLDHVIFVYGYDDDNLYVFETTETPIK